MTKKPKKPSTIAVAILELLCASKEGLDIEEVRRGLPDIGTQQHLDRRLRELDPFHVIDRIRVGNRFVYKWVKKREEGEWGYEKISKTVRAAILHQAHGKCQMCGRTISDDGIKLHIDHKIPEAWGGNSSSENLWAICSACNEGKKNYFAEFPQDTMNTILTYKTVHERIYHLLESRFDNWVDCDLIYFVASIHTPQDDWKKRTRELRYLGLKIDEKSEKHGKRVKSFYSLRNRVPLPDNMTQAIRKFEKDRAARNKAAAK